MFIFYHYCADGEKIPRLYTCATELTFKRYVISSATRRPHGSGLFLSLEDGSMNLYIYSDESGTFDAKHNKYFVFGGLVCIGKKEKEKFSRMYSHVEKVIKESSKNKKREIKGNNSTNSQKGKLFRSLNGVHKFSIIIKQRELSKDIFSDKRHKQRFLDFAYKLVVKCCIKHLIDSETISIDGVDSMEFYCDEHNTATDGIYELKETLYNEFKIGTFNYNWNKFYEPLLPSLKNLNVFFCNSKNTLLVRAADIIANKIYHLTMVNELGFAKLNNFTIFYFPL